MSSQASGALSELYGVPSLLYHRKAPSILRVQLYNKSVPQNSVNDRQNDGHEIQILTEQRDRVASYFSRAAGLTTIAFESFIY